MCGIKFLSEKENALHQYPALQHHFYRILLGVDLGDGGRGEERKDRNCLVPVITIRFSRARSTKF